MKSRISKFAGRIVAVLVLAVPFAALAQAPTPDHFRGLLNDYTPSTGVSGPWEMHGTWKLKVHKETGTADFSAVLTMEHPDSWIAANPGTSAAPNIDNPMSRSPHTHGITMTDALVTFDTSVCPVDSPTTTGRFVVTGQPSITANGSAAPFEAKGPSTLQVCVTGGALTEYSNVTLQFINTSAGVASTAVTHFGPQAIHGVVSKTKDDGREDKRDDQDHR
ncbi:MAG: hypothetical protein WA857_09630 [Candidatus Acidiferrum sp.]